MGILKKLEERLNEKITRAIYQVLYKNKGDLDYFFEQVGMDLEELKQLKREYVDFSMLKTNFTNEDDSKRYKKIKSKYEKKYCPCETFETHASREEITRYATLRMEIDLLLGIKNNTYQI